MSTMHRAELCTALEQMPHVLIAPALLLLHAQFEYGEVRPYTCL